MFLVAGDFFDRWWNLVSLYMFQILNEMEFYQCVCVVLYLLLVIVIIYSLHLFKTIHIDGNVLRLMIKNDLCRFYIEFTDKVVGGWWKVGEIIMNTVGEIECVDD